MAAPDLLRRWHQGAPEATPTRPGLVEGLYCLLACFQSLKGLSFTAVKVSKRLVGSIAARMRGSLNGPHFPSGMGHLPCALLGA